MIEFDTQIIPMARAVSFLFWMRLAFKVRKEFYVTLFGRFCLRLKILFGIMFSSVLCVLTRKGKTLMQRQGMMKGDVALRCALTLTLAVGLAPTLAYADSLDAQKAEMQTFTGNCDERANSDAAGLGSFRSFGDGCV